MFIYRNRLNHFISQISRTMMGCDGAMITLKYNNNMTINEIVPYFFLFTNTANQNERTPGHYRLWPKSIMRNCRLISMKPISMLIQLPSRCTKFCFKWKGCKAFNFIVRIVFSCSFETIQQLYNSKPFAFSHLFVQFI